MINFRHRRAAVIYLNHIKAHIGTVILYKVKSRAAQLLLLSEIDIFARAAEFIAFARLNLNKNRAAVLSANYVNLSAFTSEISLNYKIALAFQIFTRRVLAEITYKLCFHFLAFPINPNPIFF